MFFSVLSGLNGLNGSYRVFESNFTALVSCATLPWPIQVTNEITNCSAASTPEDPDNPDDYQRHNHVEKSSESGLKTVQPKLYRL